MTTFLANKQIVLGITGSIAAYKSADLVRRLRELGAQVRVVMSENAKKFITPLTMQAVSGHPVHDDLFDLQAEAAMGHIQLARWADVVLIAPATADGMARLAEGRADDLLTTLCLATSAPIMLAPAMNQLMWKHSLTQANLQDLQQRGIHIIGPAAGSQACGDTGPGRMSEPVEIIAALNNLFANGLLAGKRVLITAGPTQEAIDPIRFISNYSSGKMGYALAQAAKEAGAEVRLISGPVALLAPSGIAFESVISAEEMHAAVMRVIAQCDVFIAVAAVGDYRCQRIAPQKIAKEEAVMQITLERNPDIVAEVGRLKEKPFIVGFAAETEEVLTRARAKRERKKMDMIVANQVGDGVGMGADENEVVVLWNDGEQKLSRMPKARLARELIALIAEILATF